MGNFNNYSMIIYSSQDELMRMMVVVMMVMMPKRMIITLCVLELVIIKRLVDAGRPLGDCDWLSSPWGDPGRRNGRGGTVLWPSTEDL